jgi:hypothetical protein
VFIGVTPLLGSGDLRISACVFLSIINVAFVREACPYREEMTNFLAVVANYQILLTFLGALVLQTSSLKSFGLSHVGLGSILLGVNIVIILLAAWWCRQRRLEEIAQRAWRAPLDGADLDVFRRVMDLEGELGEGGEAGQVAVLRRYLLKASDVQIVRPIGSGSFGDVFQVGLSVNLSDSNCRNGLVFIKYTQHTFCTYFVILFCRL